MALARLFQRQLAADAQQADRLLQDCGAVPWWVPGLWHLEVANALLVAERRSVLPPADSDRFLARISSLTILTDTDPAQEMGTHILALAWAHALSSYDPTYLELAQRLGATLASFDRPLQQTATAIGISLIAAKT